MVSLWWWSACLTVCLLICLLFGLHEMCWGCLFGVWLGLLVVLLDLLVFVALAGFCCLLCVVVGL